MNPWTVLDIRATSDERDIKRAYARKLKITRPDDDPVAFGQLRDAYELAMRMAAQTRDPEQHDEHAAHVDPEPEPEPVYTAAYEFRAEDSDEQPVYTAAYEFDPDAAPEPLVPMTEARRLWAAFLPHAHYDTPKKLADLTGSADMLNLQVRDCFELCAVQYCASEGCEDSFRVALAEHFGWEEDAGFVARQMPGEAGEALARLRAHRSYTYFRELANHDEVLRVLFAKGVESPFMQAAHIKFTRRLRELCQQIRWGHREMLDLKMNLAVFEEWERYVEQKRYFDQTAINSLSAGFALWLVSMIGLNAIDKREEYAAVSFLACEILALALGAWFVLYPPAVFSSPAVSAWKDKLQTIMHDHRHRPRWQFGWIGWYALVSLCLFIPAPSNSTKVLVGIVMAIAALAGSFAISALTNKTMFGISVAFALVVGMGLGSEIFPQFGITICVLSSLCATYIMQSSGGGVLDWLALPSQRIVLARRIWLSVALASQLYVHTAQQISALIPPFLWLWILAGMLLSRPTINVAYAIFGAIGVGVLLELCWPLQDASQLKMLRFVMLAVAIFMVVNMTRAKTTQHQFS